MPQQENQEQHEEDKEDEDKRAAEPPSTINQALNGVKHLLRFKELDLDGNYKGLTILMHIERSLQQQAEHKRG
ncbi:Bgt-51450 [Blumeria graminis f. sp. tritici]|uniref:Bgt-51450 n=2 Tax=Blumeria graminis TaxID=34373 RepID=A0A9X9MEI5_BLUGR|nr:Bgt-51450 [Blumeria graminis f. sp. tritici]